MVIMWRKLFPLKAGRLVQIQIPSRIVRACNIGIVVLVFVMVSTVATDIVYWSIQDHGSSIWFIYALANARSGTTLGLVQQAILQ